MHDGGGLYLWVYSGGTKYWRMRYWWGGKEQSLSIGVYIDGTQGVTLKQARAERDVIHKLLNDGKNPSAERKAEKRTKTLSATNSFKAVALEWLEKRDNKWSERHSWNVKQRLEKDLFVTLGDRPIAEIEAPDLLETIRIIEARGSHDLSHRVLQIAGQVFRYGVGTGRCKRDVAADLRGTLTDPKRKNQNAVSADELPALLRTIARYDEFGDRQTRIALQLLSLTFVRTGELIGAEWSEFNFDDKLWVIPAERMKMRQPHVVPLATQVVTLLEELKPLSGSSRFILPGRNTSVPMSNNTALFALYRLGYKGRMCGHGFRSVASTLLNESGLWSADAVERQLAHCERNAVRGAYNKALYLPERRKMMQWWADHLDSLAAGSRVLVGSFGGAA